jgi:hypothetical protein
MCALCPHDYPNNNDNSVDKGLHTDCEALQHGQMDLSVGTDSDSGIVHLCDGHHCHVLIFSFS